MKILGALLLVALLTPDSQSKSVRNRRQIEPNPLESVVAQLSQTVEQLQATITGLQTQLEVQGRHVAFMAQFSDSNALGTDEGPYVFDSVIYNDGNAYDESTGIFTAPYSGTYIFSAQMFTDGSETEHPFVDIEVNNSTIARLAFENGGGETDDAQEDSDSTTVTIKLQQGDRVWVQSEEGRIYHYWGQFHTFFSGALLRSDNNMKK